MSAFEGTNNKRIRHLEFRFDLPNIMSQAKNETQVVVSRTFGAPIFMDREYEDAFCCQMRQIGQGPGPLEGKDSVSHLSSPSNIQAAVKWYSPRSSPFWLS